MTELGICEECNRRQANGTIGDIFDRKVCIPVCEFCYQYVLYMRPLIYEKNVRDLVMDRRHALTLAIDEDEQRKIRARYLELYHGIKK